jgi:hypothetical protein
MQFSNRLLYKIIRFYSVAELTLVGDLDFLLPMLGDIREVFISLGFIFYFLTADYGYDYY